MIYSPMYFDLQELVCKHVYNRYKQVAWTFFDPHLLVTLDQIRGRINKPVYVNSWQVGGTFTQRGFRCLRCELVKDAIANNRMYVSPHMTGQGVDFDVLDMEAEEVRQWIIEKQNLLPYPVRLESGVNWIHLDIRDNFEGKKVILFNP